MLLNLAGQGALVSRRNIDIAQQALTTLEHGATFGRGGEEDYREEPGAVVLFKTEEGCIIARITVSNAKGGVYWTDIPLL